jgi:hypothetical protein
MLQCVCDVGGSARRGVVANKLVVGLRRRWCSGEEEVEGCRCRCSSVVDSV